MNNSIHRISLDIHDTGSQVSISAKKGDKYRSLHITLTENGKPYKIAEGCYACFEAKKPDDNYIHNACEIKGNTIIYNFTTQTTAVEGTVDCEITLYDSERCENKITSPRFSLEVEDTIYNGEEIVSSPEADALKGLIGETNELIGTVEKKLENGDFIGEQGIQGIQGKPGVSGVYVGSGEMPEGYNVQIDLNGKVLTLADIIKALKESYVSSSKIGEVTLTADGWVGEESPYSQVVSIDGVTENSQVDLTPSVEQLSIFYEKDLTFVTENDDGVVTIYAIGQKPQNDYTIQVTITETEGVITSG